MSEWLTVYEKENTLLDDHELADTEETRLYALRMSYHKALNALHASSDLGDENWNSAKSTLKEMSDILKTLVCKIGKDGQQNSWEGFVLDYAQISYLVSKNLSRVLAKEEAYQQALAVGLEACEMMFELEQFDAGLIFRVASMALQNDCTWSSRQLLKFNKRRISDLYGQALTSLESAIVRRENIMSEIATLKEVSENNSTASSVPRAENGRRVLGPMESVKLINDFLATLATVEVEHIGTCCLDRVIACLNASEKGDAENEDDHGNLAMVFDLKNEGSAGCEGGNNSDLVNADKEAVDSTGHANSSEGTMVKDNSESQNTASSASSEVPKEADSSDSNRRSSRKRRVSGILAAGDNTSIQVPKGKAPTSPSRSGAVSKDGESDEFFESIHTILTSLKTAGLPFKKVMPVRQLIEELRSDDARVLGWEQVDFHKEGPALDNRAAEDGLTRTINFMIDTIISASQARNILRLLVGMILSLSQLIEGDLHGGSSSATGDMRLDFDKLALSAVKCWSHIVFMHNFSVEESLRLFETTEVLFIVECCSDFVRYADRQESKIKDCLRGCCEVSKSTLDIVLLNWSRQHSETLDEPTIVTLRRCWVFMTYWLTGRKGEQCAHISEMDTKKLLDVIRDISSQETDVRLPHMHGWNVINDDKISLLEAILQDNVKVKYLVESHEDTAEWLDSAITVMRKNGDIASIFCMGAKRKMDLISCLPLLVLETCSSLDDGAVSIQWWDHYNRVIAEGLGSVLALVKEAAEDAGEIEEWLRSCLLFIRKRIPTLQEGLLDTAALQTSRSISLLMLQAHNMGSVSLYSSLCDFSTVYLKKVKSNRIVGAFMRSTVALMADAKPSAAGTNLERSHDSLRSSVLSFAMHLVGIGSFTLWQFEHEETLGYASFVASRHNDLKGNLQWRYANLSILTTILLGWRGDEISMDQKVDLLLDYHSISCDFDLYVLDDGVCLRRIASLLQSCVKTNFMRSKKKENASDTAGTCSTNIFDFQSAGTSRQSDISTCLGEMYWLLYAFPLVTFSYVDDSSKQCTHFNLPVEDPSTIEELYIFYLDSVALGLGSRSDRRSSLYLLTQTHTLLELAPKISSYRDIFKGTFVESMPISLTTLRKAIVDEHIIDDESRRIMSLMPETLESVFYEKLVYSGDSGTGYEVLEIDYICKDFPMAEQRVLHAIELCLRDLTFNPDRYTTWVLLHVKFAEYIEIICDELGELCIPELLSSQMHMMLRPSTHISMKDLLDGSLRFSDQAIGAMEVVFRKRCGLNTGSVVRQAWCGKQLSPQVLVSLVAMKNLLREGMLTVYAVINSLDFNLLTMEMPMGHTMTEEYRSLSRFQPHVTHGRAMQLLSMDFEEDGASWRNFQSLSLRSYRHGEKETQAIQKKYASQRTRLYILCQSAKMDWTLYQNAVRTLDIIKEAIQILPSPTSRDAIRPFALNDIIPVILNISLQLLSDDCQAQITDALLDIALEISGGTIESDAAGEKVTITVVGKFHLVIPSASMSQQDKIWAAKLTSLILLRDIRNVTSKHDSPSVYTLASEMKMLSEVKEKSGTPRPEWFERCLSDNSIELSFKAALDEIHKLFVKRVPQIIAIWSVEKAEHEWDSQLQRLYTYESLRRQYTRLFVELCIKCAKEGSISKTFELAKDTWNKLKDTSKSSRRPATVRWIFDQTVRAAAKTAIAEPNLNRTILGNLFELLQVVEGKGLVSENASRKLQRAIVEIYSAMECQNREPLTPVDASLASALRYCFETFGKATDRSLFADGEKKRANPLKQAASRQVAAKTDSSSSPNLGASRAETPVIVASGNENLPVVAATGKSL